MTELTLNLNLPTLLITILAQFLYHNSNNKEPLAGDAGMPDCGEKKLCHLELCPRKKRKARLQHELRILIKVFIKLRSKTRMMLCSQVLNGNLPTSQETRGLPWCRSG